MANFVTLVVRSGRDHWRSNLLSSLISPHTGDTSATHHPGGGNQNFRFPGAGFHSFNESVKLARGLRNSFYSSSSAATSSDHVATSLESDDKNEPSQTKQKTYPCPQCGKIFNAHYNLTRHMPVHTGKNILFLKSTIDNSPSQFNMNITLSC